MLLFPYRSTVFASLIYSPIKSSGLLHETFIQSCLSQSLAASLDVAPELTVAMETVCVKHLSRASSTNISREATDTLEKRARRSSNDGDSTSRSDTCSSSASKRSLIRSAHFRTKCSGWSWCPGGQSGLEMNNAASGYVPNKKANKSSWLNFSLNSDSHHEPLQR